MSAKQEYLSWRRKSHVGCAFARAIAVRPDSYGQVVEQVSAGGTPRRIAGTIDRRVQRCIDDDQVNAVALLLPDLVAIENLAEAFLALRERPKWQVSATAIEHPSIGDIVAVGITREIPFGKGSCASEALIFGSFDIFPATRLAPLTAFEMFVGEPLSHSPKDGAPTTRANLAHLEMKLLTDNALQKAWTSSINGRLASLGGVEDSRAKAKVSFVIPAALARELGCSP